MGIAVGTVVDTAEQTAVEAADTVAVDRPVAGKAAGRVAVAGVAVPWAAVDKEPILVFDQQVSMLIIPGSKPVCRH